MEIVNAEMKEPAGPIYEFGPFRVMTMKRVLTCNGQPVSLMPKVFDTLLILIQNYGKGLGKDELMQALWPDTVVEENNLTHNISALRKAFGETPHDRRYIATIPGLGYRFVAEVKVIGNEELGEGETQREGDSLPSRPKQTNFFPLSAYDSISRAWRSKPVLLALSFLVLGLAVSVYYLSTTRSERGLPVRSIAVLPFQPLVEGSRDEALELGIADALINKLGNTNQIVIRPISSVLKYNRSGQDPMTAGRELGVEALLLGRIQKSGDRIRVTTQLMSAADGRTLWAGQFDEKFTDIFAVEDSISERLGAALALRLSGEERKRLAKHYTENTEAYHLYLKGRYFWNKRTAEGIKKSIEYFRQAIDKDPGYALAYAGMGDSYGAMALNSDAPPKESFPQAGAALARALALDDTLVEAHATLIQFKAQYDWDWPGAEKEYRRAIELNPHYPLTYFYYASYLTRLGRHEEALAAIRRAQELDPLSPIINAVMGRILFFARRYDRAIEQCQGVIEVDPDFWVAHLFLGRVYAQKGMYEQALTEFSKAKNLSGNITEARSLLGYVYAVSGKRDEARKALDELEGLSKQRYVPAYNIAMIYVGLGEKDQAFAWLNKAYEERHQQFTLLMVAPEFDSLRADPRFTELAQRGKLVP